MYRLTAATYSLFTLFCCFPLVALAQLKADFTADRTGGCAPLVVAFTNTTTGASPAATYEWDFGNGNTGHLKDAGAIFREEQAYTVTLTVRDGNQTAKKTLTITVYKKPAVDFSASLTRGCSPLGVTFTANAQAGDGTVNSYFWDFGDGYTEQSADASVAHTFAEEQTATVRLTAVNSHGCYSTAEKPGIVDVKPRLAASFSADKTVLCKETDPVQFTNTSTGPGTLTYLWEFGDGQTSTAEAPSYAFNKKGAYTVKLTATSSEGCTAEITQTNYLNVANYTSDFTLPAILCTGQEVSFNNTSQPSPASTWVVNEQRVSPTSEHLRYTFPTTGKYTVKLVNTFGTCKDSASKQVEIKPTPNSKGFVADIKNWCGAPATVEFRDTTAGAAKWEWNFDWNNTRGVQSDKQAPTRIFDQNRQYQVSLKVTNSEGCTQQIYQYVNPSAPYVYLNYKWSSNSNGNSACGPLTVTLVANTTATISDYRWDFGDGTTSTEAEPTHTFTKVGRYVVSLDYTTDKGCTGKIYYDAFEVYAKTEADFTVSSTTLCGNEQVIFSGNANGPITHWYWFFGDKPDYYFYVSQNPGYRYNDSGTYSVRLIAVNGRCADTVTKENLIKVQGPFPQISSVTNTCEGTRGEVTFRQTTRLATGGIWDFGDGTTAPFDPASPEIKHTYTKSGYYTAHLIATAGDCSYTASTGVHVLLKQNPVVTLGQSEFCSEDKIDLIVNNYDRNTRASDLITPNFSFRFQYGDGSDFTGSVTTPYYAGWGNEFIGHITGFTKGKDKIRAITTSTWFGCNDTSDYIPITIKGAAAGYEVVTDNVCFTGPVVFKDASVSYAAAIQSWEWDFGDGRVQTATQGGTVSHSYAEPGDYLVRLKVTDASGCTSRTSATAQRLSVSGPKAAFTTPVSTVPLYTAVPFYNSTNTHGAPATTYAWDFDDGATSTAHSPSHTFDRPGTYRVSLTATDPATGCRSVTTRVLTVGNFSSSFGLATSYLTARSCPPVLARFTNTSTGHTRVEWDFGNGAKAGNLNTPSHVYDKPGRYLVTLKTYGPNGLTGAYTDSVIVGQPSATLAADVLHGCTAQAVTLSAKADNGAAYFWDFGDGTVRTSTDTFARHHYGRAGLYSPQLAVRDAAGCTVSVPLGDKIIIDSLAIALGTLPATICSPKAVFFAPTVVHAAAGQGGGDLSYHWDFGTGVAADTSNLRNPSFTYSGPGAYTVRLQVASPYGCAKEASATLTAFQGLGGRIGGPAAICAGEAALFTGSTQLAGQPQWEWIFHDGTKAGGQNAPQRTYPTAGTYPVQLVVNNNGCADTVTHSLAVHALPTVSLPAPQAMVCEGSALSLTASGGLSYSWSPAEGLNTTSGATVEASPRTSTTYTVVATDAHGCSNSHSMTLTVAHPISVQLPAAASLCSGGTLALNASGATSYQWIEGGATLSGTTLPNPVARPTATTDYTVVGADAHGCFTDTATIRVTVHAAPTVNAGPDAEVLTGTPWPLQAVASADVVRYAWTPDRYLSCSACPSPEARPLEPVEYTVTVTNAQGCTASDAVAIQLLCSESRVFIPNSFTPNRDGRNDRFGIIGQGVRTVTYFRIYNRWGELVFEARDFQPGDARGTWDGAYKGLPVPAGAYVYFAEMSCEAETFTRKGTVTVVR